MNGATQKTEVILSLCAKTKKFFFRKQEVLSPQAGLDEDKVSVKEDGCNWIPSEAPSIPFASATCLNDCHRPRAKKHIHTHTDLHRKERKGNIPPMWGADSQGRGNRRGGAWERTRRQRSPSNEYLVGVLPESWLVCSSINSWILHSSFFSFSLLASSGRRILRRCGARPPRLLSGTANWIQLAWPWIFSSSWLWPNPS